MIAPNDEIMREIERRQFDLGLSLLKHIISDIGCIPFGNRNFDFL